MIDEDLKRQMEAAYLKGDKQEALELSQELDKQVTEEQSKLILEKLGSK